MPRKNMKVLMKGVPKMSNTTCKPFIEIYLTWNLEHIIYQNKGSSKTVFPNLTQSSLHTIGDYQEVLTGDLYIKVRHNGNLTNTTMCWIGFNTTFISDIQVFPIETLDPDGMRKDSWYPPTFEIKLESKPICQSCTTELKVSQRCEFC